MPTALIVEDEPEANRLLAMLVQLRGYRTDSAFTGGEALEKVAAAPPDIVFLDLMLPDMNGYDVCRALKGEKATSLIPIVMVTARLAAENRIQSFRVGADDYIPKPYTPDQIFRAMAVADEWRRAVTQDGAGVSISLTPDDSGEALRKLAQLRCLLLGRSPLDTETVDRMALVLRECLAKAEAWGRDHRAPLNGTLTFQLQDDGLLLTLQDQAGWIVDLASDASWRRSTTPPFDSVESDPDGHRLLFRRRFRPSVAPDPPA